MGGRNADVIDLGNQITPQQKRTDDDDDKRNV